MRRRLLAVACLLIAEALVACSARNRMSVMGAVEVPPDEKLIRVPPGSGGMLGVTKQILSEKGWRMVALTGPDKTVGTIEQGKVNISQYPEASARFLLYVREQFIDYQCQPHFQDYAGEPTTSHYRYAVSIVDWRTGEEIRSISGDGCLHDIVQNLKRNLP